jgi:2',3'-cyclic-nucleotide 2'-phosphodiesterase (5'-nucleotidase family)
MEPSENGWRPVGVHAGLVQVEAATALDDSAWQWIVAHQARFLASRAEVVAALAQEREDAAQFVADLMQAGTGAEAAGINRGTLRPLALRGQVRLSSLDSLMRFEDDIVLVRMPGGELQKMIKESGKRERASQQLVFAGYDEDEGTINGRPFDKSETFQVATTRFLAQGGDGYMKNKEHVEPRRGRLTLRGVTREAVENGGTLPWATRPQRLEDPLGERYCTLFQQRAGVR